KEAAAGQQVPFSVYDTGLGKECELESLAYEADSSRLVMACKRLLNKQERLELRIFGLTLRLGSRMALTSIRVPLDEAIGTDKCKNLHPSDLNIDPFNENSIIVASREKGFVEVTPDGEVVRSQPLPGDHRQPEGIAITRDSILLVSDEANVMPPVLTLY